MSDFHQVGDPPYDRGPILGVPKDDLDAMSARIATLGAENKALRAALDGLIPVVEAVMKEEGRSIEWGEEDPFRMGEWFEDEDRDRLEAARAALKE